MSEKIEEFKRPSLLLALIPLAVLIVLLVLNVVYFGDAVLDGPNQVALLLAAAVCGTIGYFLKVPLEYMLKRINKTIYASLTAVLILLLIGCLSASWLVGGVIPSMIYYGIDIMHPSYFLVASTVLCSLVSISTGSSWSTVATVGVAIIGIGHAFGMNEAVVAGAIISGAYFGDKMSPMSDTTNLAAVVAGTDLFTHIRYMVYTTGPTFIISLLIYTGIGLFMDGGNSMAETHVIKGVIEESFVVSPILLLVPIALVVIIALKVPAVPAMLIGSGLGVICALVFQQDLMNGMIAEGLFENKYHLLVQALGGGIDIPTQSEAIGDLLSSGGMSGMLATVWLILSAMTFGGIMEACGTLKRITDAILSIVYNTTSLIGSTILSCIVFNLITSDQYLSIVVPGKMMADSYRKRGLKPEVLSRALEDSATVTSPLIPWNTCGATQARVLGVSTWAYAPYAFFCIISPLMNLLITFLNFKIRRLSSQEMENDSEE